jgi:hypothetical protein
LLGEIQNLVQERQRLITGQGRGGDL